MQILLNQFQRILGKIICRAALLSTFVFAALSLSNSSNVSAQILAVVGDNHEDLASLLKAIDQAKALGATDFLITGDAIKGDAKDLSRMFTLNPSRDTVNKKLEAHRLELENVLSQVVAHAGVPKERIHFLKGNYEDWGYFHDNPLRVRQTSDHVISQFVTPINIIGRNRPVHDDELGIVEIATSNPATGERIVYKLVVSHKPLIQLPYDKENLANSMVQDPSRQTNWRNKLRRDSRLQEPDTRTTMTYEDEGKIRIPLDAYAYLGGHTHIAGGFYHALMNAEGEIIQMPVLNSGSANPTKKPRDQFESFMLLNLQQSRATWHDIADEGKEIRSWNFGRHSSGKSVTTQTESCMRIMRDNGPALSALGKLSSVIKNMLPRPTLKYDSALR